MATFKTFGDLVKHLADNLEKDLGPDHRFVTSLRAGLKTSGDQKSGKTHPDTERWTFSSAPGPKEKAPGPRRRKGGTSNESET